MHGRKKVEISDAEKEIKAKERAKKLQIYSKIRDAIFEKREKGIYDEEGLKLTAQILAVNPDIYTFWNYRKLALQHLLNVKNPIEHESTNENCDDLLFSELQLTETCLENNPKSYGAWHHRGWVLIRMKKPNFRKEIKQCEAALTLDERNFHCWDHWRIVCKLANVNLEEQIEFSDKKVKENFSNYSAWHYRSTLLPGLFADADGILPIRDEKFSSELEMIHNANFTDPDDQSTWFYRNWLFTRIEPKMEDDATNIYVNKIFGTLSLLFEKPVVLSSKNVKISLNNGILSDQNWKSIDNSRCNRLWTAEIDNLGDFCETSVLSLIYESGRSTTMNFVKSTENMLIWSKNMARSSFNTPLPENLRKNLEFDLKQMSELSALESNKKWPLLITVTCMKMLDFEKYEDKIFDGLTSLKHIDPMRKIFYDDLLSKWRIEKCLSNNLPSAAIQLKGLSLTRLYFTDHMCHVTDLNLSANQLTSLSPLIYLISLQMLNVSSNKLTTLKGLQELKGITSVDASRNLIARSEDFAFLVNCKSLKQLNLQENPVTKLASVEDILKQCGTSIHFDLKL